MLGLPPRRSPCVATLHRVFTRLDVATFERVVGQWLAQTGVAPNEVLAVDVKTLRGVRGDLPAVHLVGLYATQASKVLAQVDLTDQVVVGDALQTQREMCAQIVAKGDFIFPVKDNQPALLTDLTRTFAPLCAGEPTAPRPAPVAQPIWQQRQWQERGGVLTTVIDAPAKARHGRYERRQLWLLADPAWTDRLGDLGHAGTPWPHVRQLYRLERWGISRRTGEATQKVTFGITSLPPERADATRVLAAIRAYWGIENRLHYVRSVAMGEDASQGLSGAAPQAVAACRNLAIALLRRRHC